MIENKTLVEVKNLKEYFNITTGMFTSKPLKAVDDVSFAIRKGETLGLVGESGCGKTTVGRTLLHLYKPTAGEIWFDGKKIETKKDILEYRQKSAMVFQDPYSSLNPRMTVSDIIAEPLDVHKMYQNKKERQEKIEAALADVGLVGCADKRPDELSGGMRQRAAFARTMLTGNDLLLLDEPFSALDFLTRISMQEWLLDQWQKTRKTILFITHDVEEALFLSSSVLVVEETPIRTLREIPVPMDYPRSRKDLAGPEIIALREELIGMLRKQVTE